MASTTGDWTYIELVNDTLAIVAGKTKDPNFIHIKLACDLVGGSTYGVPTSTFSSTGPDSISKNFPNALCMQVQVDFRTEDTKDANVKDFADWLNGLIAQALDINFSFPCSVFFAVTDATHLYQPTNDDMVAAGDEKDASDHPVVVIMSNKGRLTQVGMTGRGM